MALFGASAPTVAAMLSIFMGGLTLGSYGAGSWGRHWNPRKALLAYAVIECWIGLGGLIAKPMLEYFRTTPFWLDVSGVGARWFLTCAFLAMVLLPWTIAMGATYPIFLAAIPKRDQVSFSWLYAANVAGAMLGTLAAGFVFFEYFGFRKTQWIGVTANGIAAALAITWYLFSRSKEIEVAAPEAAGPSDNPSDGNQRLIVATFVIGLVSLGYEVAWTRIYTPVLGTVVYAFSALLATYLGATFVGSVIYRWLLRRRWDPRTMHSWLGPLVILSGVLPYLATVPTWLSAPAKVILGLTPFCLLTGLWTPLLVEQYAAGSFKQVGRIYAWNGLGCLLGPLVTGFILLPYLGISTTMLVLTLLLAIPTWLLSSQHQVARLLPLILVIPGFSLLPTFEEKIKSPWVLNDSTATVAAWGADQDRRIFVNGSSMTGLVNETKWMVHLPALFHGSPKKILVICFGMGTSYRSALSWGADVTAVELVPSVVRMFPYFHADVKEVLKNPRGRIVVDDGRHFLETSKDFYDIIIVDPPPPIQAAGSSMLNSRGFFHTIRQRLSPGGVLMQWTPGGEFLTEVSQICTLADEFPNLLAFRSSGRVTGMYMLASAAPLRAPKFPEAMRDAPPRAISDMQEWVPEEEVLRQFQRIMEHKVEREDVLRWQAASTRLTDDFPVNEYYWIRCQSPEFKRIFGIFARPPPVIANLLRFAGKPPADFDQSRFAADLHYVVYRIALTLHQYELAAWHIQALAALHPDDAECRQLAAAAQQLWKKEEQIKFER